MISEKEKFFDFCKPSFCIQTARDPRGVAGPDGWRGAGCGAQRAVLDFRFLDMALSARTPVPDERVRRTGHRRREPYYQPSALLRLLPGEPKISQSVVFAHGMFHCVFRHSIQGQAGCPAVESGLRYRRRECADSLNRSVSSAPLTWGAPERLRLPLPRRAGRSGRCSAYWAGGPDPGILRQLEREFYTDDHRLWAQGCPLSSPSRCPRPCPRRRGRRSVSGCRPNLDLRDKGKPVTVPMPQKQQVKAANRSRRSYQDFLRRFCV